MICIVENWEAFQGCGIHYTNGIVKGHSYVSIRAGLLKIWPAESDDPACSAACG